MVDSSRPSLQIDLNEFKLHLHLRGRTPLTLLFNSPSRSFYLSVIALVVNEMKKSGKIRSIPLQEHLDLLALLNETIGGAAGSSDKENLLHRIYTKWKDALPNLEEAPLFKVHGKKKKEEGDGAIGKVYSFSDAEKDGWANLFDYVGSEENVRLKFAIDKIGVGLNEISIIFGDSLNGKAWDRFISSLKNSRQKESESMEQTAVPESLAVPFSSPQERKILWLTQYRWVILAVMVGIVAVGIWRIYLSPAPITVASIDRMKYPLPDKPSIAVLPFENLSKDPNQEFLCDGMAEEIITALSKVTELFVIARNSTFTYKGKPVKVNQVSEDLGVRYVLEGGFQRSGDRVRITAQLIDALTGNHLWGERYDRDLKDIFVLQDEITLKIMTALQLKLIKGDAAPVMAKGAKNLDSYIRYIQSLELFDSMTKEGNVQGRKLLEEAIALDPEYPRLYMGLATTHFMDVWFGTTESPDRSLTQAFELAQKAISLDGSNSTANAYSLLGAIYGMRKQYDRGIADCERAVSLDPNSAENYVWLGTVLTWAGRAEEAVKYLEYGIRLNPWPPTSCFNNLAVAYRDSGQYEKAIDASKKALQREPNTQFPYIHIAISYIRLGREEEARTAAAEILRVNPKFSLDRYAKILPYTQSVADRVIEDLRKAGLK